MVLICKKSLFLVKNFAARKSYGISSHLKHFSSSCNKIKIVEVGPRDGLQNEKNIIPTEKKVELIDKLTDAGFKYIEVSSFVSPKWVPQLADSISVFKQIKRNPGVIYAGLVPNIKGFESAVEANVDEIAIFGAASESFSKRNINCSIEESFDRFKPVIDAAKKKNIPVRGYVSCIVSCPIEGPISPENVLKVTTRLLEMGCREVSLGDTIGAGTTDTVDAVLKKVTGHVNSDKLAVHFHDTYGNALENITLSLNDYNIRAVDSAVGGLGGCPYAGPGVPGNVSTENVLAHLNKLGYETDGNIDTEKATQIGKWIRTLTPK